MSEPSLALLVLTFNEEGNLPRCLESARALGCPIYAIDSGSTDATLEIAARHGAQVLRHAFETHTAQWTWALQNLPERYGWILALDADQSLTPELAREILETLPRTAPGGALAGIDGFFLNRRNVFRGKWLRHGGLYPKYLLKMFRPDKVYQDANDLVDHHFYIDGRTAKLRYDLVEENVKERDICFWAQKHIRYAALLAEEEHRRRGSGVRPAGFSPWSNPDHRVLWMKGLWGRMPGYIRPFLYFLYRYVLRLGFLDGKQGFVFHFMQALWFRTLVDIKSDEIRSAGDRAS